MKERNLPYLIGAGLLVSGSLIAGLASADMKPNKKHGPYISAKRLDVNKDGMISLEELSVRQDRRFSKLDRNGDGSINKAEFNARLEAMFKRMDVNNDGVLSDAEMPKQRHKRDTS